MHKDGTSYSRLFGFMKQQPFQKHGKFFRTFASSRLQEDIHLYFSIRLISFIVFVVQLFHLKGSGTLITRLRPLSNVLLHITMYHDLSSSIMKKVLK